MKKSMSMKKLLSIALMLTFIISTMYMTNVYASDDISVTINGERVSFPGGQNPVIVGGRTLVPVRGVFEHLGFDVDWQQATSTAIITSTDHELRITIGNNIFTANGVSHTLDVPAQLIDGRTMVPIRLPLESVGYTLDWNNNTRTVVITAAAPTPQPTQTPIPTPTPTPSPTPTPTPSPSPTPPPPPPVPQSQITLNNRRLSDTEMNAWVAEYYAMGGPSQFELDMLAAVNETRAQHGARALEMDTTLMKAARLHTQFLADLNWSAARDLMAMHTANPYGSSLQLAISMGMRGNASAANGSPGSRMNIQGIINGWLNSPGHRENLLSSRYTVFGFGYSLGGPGGGNSYLILSAARSSPTYNTTGQSGQGGQQSGSTKPSSFGTNEADRHRHLFDEPGVVIARHQWNGTQFFIAESVLLNHPIFLSDTSQLEYILTQVSNALGARAGRPVVMYSTGTGDVSFFVSEFGTSGMNNMEPRAVSLSRAIELLTRR